MPGCGLTSRSDGRPTADQLPFCGGRIQVYHWRLGVPNLPIIGPRIAIRGPCWICQRKGGRHVSSDFADFADHGVHGPRLRAAANRAGSDQRARLDAGTAADLVLYDARLAPDAAELVPGARAADQYAALPDARP